MKPREVLRRPPLTACRGPSFIVVLVLGKTNGKTNACAHRFALTSLAIELRLEPLPEQHWPGHAITKNVALVTPTLEEQQGAPAFSGSKENTKGISRPELAGMRSMIIPSI